MKGHSSREEGFTLIELLVVILIIGILSAIAVPAFINQRKAANDVAVKSDARSVVLAVETYFIKNPNSTVSSAWLRDNIKKSEGVSITVRGAQNDFCVEASHPEGDLWVSGKTWAQNNNIRPYYLYSSKNGGEFADTGVGVSSLSCFTAGGTAVW